MEAAAMTSELDPEARALIGLALRGERRLPRHPERVRRRVLAGLAAPAVLGATDAAAAGKAAGVVTGTAATGTKVVLFGTVTWLKAAPLVVLGMAASVVGLKQLHSTPPAGHVATPALVAPPTAVRRKAAPVVIAAPAGAQMTVPAEERPAPPSAPLKVNPDVPASGVETPIVALAPPSLAAELDALQRAQRALNAGNAAGALLELRGVRGQTLRAERTALEVFAHCALGNVALARQQAALFRELAPRSPLLPRVDASCAAE
jgi:hypothetical protein